MAGAEQQHSMFKTEMTVKRIRKRFTSCAPEWRDMDSILFTFFQRHAYMIMASSDDTEFTAVTMTGYSTSDEVLHIEMSIMEGIET